LVHIFITKIRRKIMHEVRADLDKNRMYITIGRIENEAEKQALVEDVKNECAKLDHGFTALTDLRNYQYQGEAFERYIKELQEACIARGMSEVVRVHRWSGLLGHMEFETVSLDVGYSGKNVTTIEEAEKILDRVRVKQT
jgi:hypothetical protein